MITGHGGNIHEVAKMLGCAPADIMDMSSNVNPMGPMPGLLRHLENHLQEAISALPQADASHCVNAFANCYQLDSKCVLAANGTTQFIYTIPKALNTKKALVLAPTYSDYADACAMHDVACDFFVTKPSAGFIPEMEKFKAAIKTADTIFICNPNNPTSVLLSKKHLLELCHSFPAKRFVIDESYLPFVEQAKKQSMMDSGLDNVLVLNSMSKIFRIPGLRIGFIVAAEKIIDRFRHYLMPWSVNSLAQQAIFYLMTHKVDVDQFIDASRKFLSAEKDFIAGHLADTPGVRLFPSATSFILAELTAPHSAVSICDQVLKDRILLRNCANFKGLNQNFIRISIKTHRENTAVVSRLQQVL